MDTVRPIDPTHVELAASLAAQGVTFVVGAWVDVLGRSKSKMVPISHLPGVLAGSERYTPRGMGDLGVMNPSEDECVGVPDPATLQVLPWDARVAFMNADLFFGGTEPFANCPRSILKRALASAVDAGYDFQLGVETEFHVFREDRLPDLVPLNRSSTVDPTPAYDVESTLDSLPFLAPMVSYMDDTGFGLFSFDHEGGDGQYEFDFSHDGALAMCDRLTLFRLMLKQTAKQTGGVVSFMPKPSTAGWGSGAHMNMSLEAVDTGANLFRDADDPAGLGWSKLAYGFVAGLLRHARALSAITCPTVNSYKRLRPHLADGTVSWAPVYAAYGDNNRSCMLRLPRNRPAIENRGVDAAANMYLAAALSLAAGLEGIATGADPGPPAESIVYDWVDGDPATVHLPRNLLEAIDAFEQDELVHATFPCSFIAEYTAMKRAEWDDYHAQVTDWERDRYLTNI
jgi:glutamine synthetase